MTCESYRRTVTLIGALLVATALAAAEGPRKIVLIGGTKSEGPGRHDYPNAVRVLERLLSSSPDLESVLGLDIESHPDGWPHESAFEGASTLVWYFDGLDKHPLLAAERREQFQALMRAGVGLGRPAWLAVDQLERTLVFENPGSPVVTSNGSRDAVVWVLDPNARRSALLVGAGAPRPVLYALDAMTLEPLWRSEPGLLHASGKYNEPTIARGTVFVGTDRIQAFGTR